MRAEEEEEEDRVPKPGPVTMLCTYHPKKGKEAELFALVQRHWATLRKAGLVTDEPATVYKAFDVRSQETYFVEIFSWKDEKASGLAHGTPEVQAVWGPMGEVMSEMSLSQIERTSEA